MKTVKIVLGLVALILFFIFSVNNRQEIQLSFFDYRSPSLPLFLLLLVIFLLGVLLASLIGTVRLSQVRRKMNHLRRENESLRRERDAVALPPEGGPAV